MKILRTASLGLNLTGCYKKENVIAKVNKKNKNGIFIPPQDMLFHQLYALNLHNLRDSNASETVLIAKYCLERFD